MNKLLKSFLLAALLIGCQNAFSQLTDFTLSVTATSETCTGNGALHFATSGTTEGAAMIYSVFLLPDTTTPIATLTATSMTGLTSGNYLVVATQTLGNLTNSQQQQISIANEIVALSYEVSGDPGNCANGTITVTAQGNVASYEIISGPEIVPPQTSNVFPGLAVGTYNIRVTDTCGDALVQTFTLKGSTFMLVSQLSLGCSLVDCDTVQALFTVNADIDNHPDMVIAYPLQVTITVYPPTPPGAAPIVVTQTINSGDPIQSFIMSQIPYFENLHYGYEISVTDSCGHTFVNTGNEIFEAYTVTLETFTEDMQSNLYIRICHGLPPYTVNFVSAPAGFNPVDFNATHPGPFMNPTITYNSNDEQAMPDGLYHVVVTDACGNTFDGEVSLSSCITSMKVDPICPKLGHVMIPGDVGALVASASIGEAPPDFPYPLPFNLADYIIDGQLSIELPPGDYTVNGLLVCNKLFTFHISIFEPSIDATGENAFGCSTITGKIKLNLLNGTYLQSVVIVSAPAGYNHPLPFDVSDGIPISEPKKCEITGLMYGDYILHVTDFCGNLYVVNVTVPLNISQNPPFVRALSGCGPGFGTLYMTSDNVTFQQVVIVSAPPEYPSPLPHDVSFNITFTGTWSMNALPEGEYTFYTKDVCGVEHTFEQTVSGFHLTKNEIEMLGNCGSFNVRVDYEPAQVFAQTFWLQKYNPVTNQWCHPFTGVAQLPDYTPDVLNAYELTNGAINYNIAAYGHFRVMKRSQVYNNGNAPGWFFCVDNLNEFDYTGQLKISSAYSIPCSNGNSQVIIIAGETSPLTYRITEKDGLPFLVENGELNIFTGLESGVYNFQVQDQCGNIANRLFDIISLSEPQIMPHNLCNGQSGFLSVLPISYLNYQWWNGNDPGTILSTGSSLYFSPFSQIASAGTYYVRIYSPTSLSCIDTTLSYTILPSIIPNAGEDATVALCGGSASIDLSSLLGGDPDDSGYWTETTNSGLLNGHTWLPIGLPQGTYVFKYRVDGFCDVFDDAALTINLQGAAPIPAITVNQESCSGGNIQFSANDILDAAYHWTGPNNFSSDLQQPTIANTTAANNGTYTLVIDVNGCQATATAQITVNTTADFNLVQSCSGGAYQLTAVPNENGFDPATVTFNWTGPQNFTSSQNPITITGLASGEYSVTVAHNADCEVTQSIAVGTTRCGFPSGISPNHDGLNEVFDLTGYDVVKLEIFSRYGRLVFEQDNYTNQWHGQDYNGRELPDATYYYYIRLSTGEEKTGWVYVTK
jgi:gliding motility-associated-like protein